MSFEGFSSVDFLMDLGQYYALALQRPSGYLCVEVLVSEKGDSHHYCECFDIFNSMISYDSPFPYREPFCCVFVYGLMIHRI